MVTRYLLLPLLLSWALASSANDSLSRYYVRIGVGYGMGVDGQLRINGNIISGDYIDGYNGGLDHANANSVSFGQSVKIAPALGFYLSQHVALEVGFLFDIASSHYKANYSQYSPGGSYDETVTTYSRNTYSFIPALVLQLPSKKLVWYERTGVVLPLNSKIGWEKNGLSYSATKNSETNLKGAYYSRFSAGLHLAMGCKIKLNHYLELSLEGFCIWRNAYASSFKVERYDIDGVAQPLPETTSFSNSTNQNEPQSFAIPYSNAGLMAGLCLSF